MARKMLVDGFDLALSINRSQEDMQHEIQRTEKIKPKKDFQTHFRCWVISFRLPKKRSD